MNIIQSPIPHCWKQMACLRLPILWHIFVIPALRHGGLAMDAGDPVANVKLLRFAGAAGYSWTRQP